MDEQLVQGCYATACGRFEPATLWLQDNEHTTTSLQATASEALFQGLHVAARVGFELATLRTQGIDLPLILQYPQCPIAKLWF